MKFNKTDIEGCYLITYDSFVDERGFFSVPYNKDVFNSNVGYDVEFVQDNMSYSHLGTIRGLHFQTGEYEQAKLVTCTSGRVLDIIVDSRKDSPSYGKVVEIDESFFSGAPKYNRGRRQGTNWEENDKWVFGRGATSGL